MGRPRSFAGAVLSRDISEHAFELIQKFRSDGANSLTESELLWLAGKISFRQYIDNSLIEEMGPEYELLEGLTYKGIKDVIK
jgi:hypothetical protein